jgi:WD40 repeat protein
MQRRGGNGGGSWFNGGERCGAAGGAHLTVQGDCLASDSSAEAVCCIGADGDNKSVSVFSSNGAAMAHCQTLIGHTQKVLSVAVYGDVIASGSRDKTIRVWSRSSGECTGTLICGAPVHGLALRVVNGCAEHLLSGEGNAGRKEGRACLWSISSMRLICTFDEHRGPVWSCALGERVALTASHDTTARTWPVGVGSAHGDGGSVASMGVLQHPEWVCSVSVFADDLAATGCADGSVRVWSLATLECTLQLEHGQGAVFCVRLLCGGVLCASGGQDETVKLWDLARSGEQITTLEHGAIVRGLAGLPGRTAPLLEHLVSAGGKTAGSVVVWRPGK